ncbi:MAG: metallophosphoesterase [Oceanicaulis sp.]
MTRILHLADLHFGAEDPPLVEGLAEALQSLEADVICAAGDFTQYGRKREFRAAADFFARLDPPVVAAPGNHDTPYWDLFSRLIRPWGRFEKLLGGTVRPDWRDKSHGMETLATSRGLQARLDWSLGKVREAHAREAAERLGDVHGVRIVAGHHPLFAPGGAKGRAKTKGGSEATSILAEAGVDIVLSGHLHQAFAIAFERPDGGKSWHVGASTALSKRTRDEPAGFNVIDLEDGAALLTIWAATKDYSYTPISDQRLDLTRRG